ncbi:MAG: serine hydrolase domain-containing protein [Cellulosilyticaceae bacterium]
MKVISLSVQNIEEIRSMMEKQKVAGLSYAIISGGSISSSGTLGIINSETGEEVAFDTRFEAASLTKPLFAYFIMLLYHKGIIDLDRPICTYLPQEQIGIDDRYKNISPRHVLSHGSGFPNWSSSHPIEQIFDAGSGFEYSGEGYYYLQRALENIFSNTIDKLMEEYILQPLGMTHSSFVRTPEINAHLSRSFDKCGNMEVAPEVGYKANAAYSLYTTAEDYAKFIVSLIDVQKGVVPKSMIEQMFIPQNKINDDILWGLGLGIVPNEPQVLWHWGDNGGFKAFMSICPQLKCGCVMFSNGYGGTPLCMYGTEILMNVDLSHVASYIATLG